MRALARLEADFEVTVVAGGGNPHYESLQELVKRLPGKVQLERSSVNMAAIMRWADVAISAAGGTCWELAYLGVPMILITASRDQEENASAISKTGAALSLGWHANLSEDDILEAIKKVMNDPEGRGAMSKSGRALVDGKGAARVVEFLQSCV
jgi:spore coat polysaccharide biosynthesis predicted glycosyltransferase SpsG